MMEDEKVIKCVVVGDGAVGKTCMLISYTLNEFPKTHVPTIFETYEGQIKVNSNMYKFSLYDTAGQEDWSALRTLGYKDTGVFLVCFSVMNKDSFYHWVPELKHHCPTTPYIVVGTQIDRRTNPEDLERLHQSFQHPIETETGQALAKTVNAADYVECSALTQVGLKNVFDKAITISLRKTCKQKCAIL